MHPKVQITDNERTLAEQEFRLAQKREEPGLE